MSGDVHVSGLLRIDGDFSGTIEATGTVFIGRNGRAESSIQAETVVIGGVVKGDINADQKVIILSSGMVIGDITTPRLVLEEGVIFNGNSLVSNKAVEEIRRIRRSGAPQQSQRPPLKRSIRSLVDSSQRASQEKNGSH